MRESQGKEHLLDLRQELLLYFCFPLLPRARLRPSEISQVVVLVGKCGEVKVCRVVCRVLCLMCRARRIVVARGGGRKLCCCVISHDNISVAAST